MKNGLGSKSWRAKVPDRLYRDRVRLGQRDSQTGPFEHQELAVNLACGPRPPHRVRALAKANSRTGGSPPSRPHIVSARRVRGDSMRHDRVPRRRQPRRAEYPTGGAPVLFNKFYNACLRWMAPLSEAHGRRFSSTVQSKAYRWPPDAQRFASAGTVRPPLSLQSTERVRVPPAMTARTGQPRR